MKVITYKGPSPRLIPPDSVLLVEEGTKLTETQVRSLMCGVIPGELKDKVATVPVDKSFTVGYEGSFPPTLVGNFWAAVAAVQKSREVSDTFNFEDLKCLAEKLGFYPK